MQVVEIPMHGIRAFEPTSVTDTVFLQNDGFAFVQHRLQRNEIFPTERCSAVGHYARILMAMAEGIVTPNRALPWHDDPILRGSQEDSVMEFREVVLESRPLP